MNEYLLPVRIDGPNIGFTYALATQKFTASTQVVVETFFGLEIGVVIESHGKEKSVDSQNYPLVIRQATKNDLFDNKRNKSDAVQALDFCKDTIKRHHLDMQLLQAYYSLNRSKLLFIYTSEGRVDFRELLKEISSAFRTRIELRQIGTRDRSQLVGGYASCGMPLCCHTFIDDFDGISINMAKNQMLTLNVQKLSGHCNKLLCCLQYEDEMYSKIKAKLPKIGIKLRYQNKEYRLVSYNIISRIARLDNEDGATYIDFNTLNKIAK